MPRLIKPRLIPDYYIKSLGWSEEEAVKYAIGLFKNGTIREINGKSGRNLLNRIVNRRSCPKCGEIYNLKYHPPKTDGICDKCGESLTQRKDDNAETAQARFDTYFKETAPLIEYYTKKGILRTLDANGSIDEVWERMLEIIK